MSRIVIIVLDSAGVGAAPDAAQWGDGPQVNTIGNVARSLGGLSLPHLEALGLGRIVDLAGADPSREVHGIHGRMRPRSPGKDTMGGHWEMMGLILDEPFQTFPQGFPRELMERFEDAIGRKTLGNYPASGTVIIEELGPEHLRTGRPIVYTSADSVFQVAAHEDVIPVDELYRICHVARDLLTGPYLVGRVIARPFVGKSGAFVRTGNRRDLTVPPLGPTVLDALASAGVPTHGIGKIGDIFSGRGLSTDTHTGSNREGLEQVLAHLGRVERGLIFANLVDFDSKYGHRRDVEGYARALQEVDAWVERITQAMGEGDVLIFTADHGCDPTAPGTDHTREEVPILGYTPGGTERSVGLRRSLADLGATVAEAFGVASPAGESFLGAIQ